jgi:hypothetical protein
MLDSYLYEITVYVSWVLFNIILESSIASWHVTETQDADVGLPEILGGYYITHL